MDCSIKLGIVTSFNNFKAIYFAIFDSHINYANLIWGGNLNYMLKITTGLKKDT